jgi:outer membrane protein OmpA-like peptidoglycan-associated protein/tetratricopeptide (TPR) repeat protein
MKASLRFLLFVCCVLSLHSCVSVRLRTANENYKQSAYAPAAEDYEYVLTKRQDRDAIINVADCYYQMGNSYKAEFWYRRAVKLPDAKTEWNYFLGESLIKNGKYEEAKTYLSTYCELNKADYRAQNMLASCDSVSIYYRDTTLFTITPLRYNAPGINVLSPSFYRSGIVFLSDMNYKGLSKTLSDWTGKRYLDLFFAKKTDRGNWLDPEPLRGSVNGRFNEGPVAFTHDFNTMYFTRNNYLSNKVEKNKRNDNVLKIFRADFVNGEWSIVGDINMTNGDYSVGHPTLNSTGDVMFFVSNMPWGYGGTDIYSSRKVGNSWSEPVNIGKGINTDGNEMFPFLYNDSTLYFASDGRGGLGGLDIFESKFKNGDWSTPFNMGAPVNSPQDDFSFIIDSTGLNGYFTSGRGSGNDKIFSFLMNPPRLLVNVKISDQQSHALVAGATLSVVKDGKVFRSVTSDGSGYLKVLVEPGHNYDFICDHHDFYLRKASVSTEGKRFSDTLAVSIDLKKIVLNKPFVWYGIAFKKKDFQIKTSANEALDLLLNLLKENPRLEVEIGSYTDSRGTDADNLRLTQSRADFVVKYLTDRGLNPSRFTAKGYGESKLLNNCVNGLLCIEEEHETNNRIEITVKSIAEVSVK